MREFFRGWKRKLGVVTLLMACVFVAAEIRGRFYEDWRFVRIGQTYYLLQSQHGGFSYHKWPKPPPSGQWFGSRSAQSITILGIGTAPSNHFFLDYSTSAILLTPLAAWLLLSRSRTSRPVPEAKA